MSLTFPFKSNLVFEEKINKANLRAYYIGYDQNKFRLAPLLDIVMNVIIDFVGMTEQLTQYNSVEILRRALKQVYTTDKYKSRGELGEIVLHLLLRDFFGSTPLLSKMYFKDTFNATVHGFDAVHIVEKDTEKQLWLGESKLYLDGKAGIQELVTDLKSHLEAEYLRNEFALISNKLNCDESTRYWLDLLRPSTRLDQILSKICIPALCTYSSATLKKHTHDSDECIKEFIHECENLHDHFEMKKAPITTNVDVFLLLLPVPCKNELVDEFHNRLKMGQIL